MAGLFAIWDGPGELSLLISERGTPQVVFRVADYVVEKLMISYKFLQYK